MQLGTERAAKKEVVAEEEAAAAGGLSTGPPPPLFLSYFFSLLSTSFVLGEENTFSPFYREEKEGLFISYQPIFSLYRPRSTGIMAIFHILRTVIDKHKYIVTVTSYTNRYRPIFTMDIRPT